MFETYPKIKWLYICIFIFLLLWQLFHSSYNGAVFNDFYICLWFVISERGRKITREPPPEQDPDDVVDISYVGGNIPSRSFKMLQQSVGEPGKV